MITRPALDAFRLSLATNVTGMSAEGKVAAVAKDASRDVVQPSLQLVPGKFLRDYSRAVAIAQLAGQRGLWKAGYMTAPVQLRVIARTPKEREPLEARVVALFGPGGGKLNLFTGALTLDGVVTTYSAPVEVRLLASGWQEGGTDERRRYSFLDCTVMTEILFLTGLGTLPTMTEIVLHTTHDMETAYPAVVTKDFQIEEDGSATELP